MYNTVSTQKVFERFNKYLKTNFDLSNEQIYAKYEHIKSVFEIATDIAYEANFSEEDLFIAQVIAILHDCARFPQIVKYGSFKDTAEYNHSIEGGKLLENGLLQRMIPETRKYDEIIIPAVTYHGLLDIPSNLDERTKLHCELIRDADRTDLFNLMINHFEVLFWSEQGEPNITPKVKELFENGKPIEFHEVKSQLDFLALRFGLLCQYKFKPALEFIKEKDYINRITDMFLEKRPFYNKEDVEWVRQVALSFLK